MSIGLGEQQKAYRLYVLNWVILGTIGLFIGSCFAVSKFWLELEVGLLTVLFAIAVLTALGHFLLLRAWGARPGFILVSVAQIMVLILFGVLLPYIAASANLPLQDAMLDHWDRLLGLNWIGYYQFMTAHPALLPYALLFYAAIALPQLGVPILLGLTKNYVRQQQFTMATILTLCIVAFISAFIPAIGTFQQYGVPAEFSGFRATGYLVQLEHLPLARSGAMRVLNIWRIGGIVTFPSFHAAAAVLGLWGWWGVWWMRPFALTMCAGMLAATPLMGGHYFVDIFAGVAVTSLAIAFATAIDVRFPAFSRAVKDRQVTAEV
jgi:hypothetical protein